MTKLPAGQLAYTPVVEKQDEFLATVRRLGEVASQALVSGNSDALRLELERTAKVADDTTRKLSPLTQATAELERHWQSLTNTIKASGAVRSADLKALRDVETQLKAQVGTLGKYASEQTGLGRVLKNVSAETKALGASQRGVTYQTADVAKYAAALKAITDAQRAGLTSQKDSLAQLKSLQGAMAQYAGSLTEGSRELTALNKVMVATGTASNKLEKEQAKLEAAFRSDYLKIYSGELKSIDAAVRSGTSGFDAGARQVERLSAELRSQQGELGQTGKDFDQLSRLLQQAAAQQERYQKAAQAAARSNDTAQLRAFGTELRQLEAGLQDVTVQAGKLDAQQRAIRYDSAGVRSYRTETEGLSGAFGKVGQGLGDLQSRIVTYARGLSDSGQNQAELTRIMQGTEKAAQSLAQAQERTAQSYRSAELSRFTTELKNIETAQKAGAISAEQAQRAVQELQTEFKAYAASLGVTERELSTFARSQQDAGKSADQFAQAQERAQRSFDTRALSSFRGELEQIIRGQREGEKSFDQTARAVESLQSRMREYGSSLGTAGSDQADLNRLLELSERALTEVGTAAERAGRGFNAAPVRDYGRELDGLGDAGQRLEGSLSGIGDDLDRLGGSFRETGQDARASAQDHEAFGSATRELDGSLAGIEQELSQLGASFREAGTDARTSAGEQERLGVSLRDLGGSLGNTAGEFTQLGGAVRESGSSANLTQWEYQGLEGVMRSLEGAAGRLASEQEKLDAAFHAEQLRGYNSALLDLKRAHEAGASSQEQFTASARELSDQLERSRVGLDTSSKAYVGYTQALTRVDSSLAQAEGRMRTFGVASAVTAGVGDQLQNVLFALGPAGEAMGVAMGTAGAGMAGATVAAKALNIALAAGVVGAVIATAVAIGGLVKNMFALDTGLTDVQKTTGFTQGELNGLAKELQNIALNTGTPVRELTELAGVAGSLGVTGVQNVAQFTDTMNKLAVATDIVGEEGAKQLASFINVTKAAGDSVGDSATIVGNVIVRLGNSLAATEAPILAMASRLGGLSTTANLSQAEILALSGAYVSLGFTAEGAGTSLQSVVNKIAQAGKEGGATLDSFARGAGLTREEFQKLAAESPAAAFQAYIGGLKEAKDAGVNINPVIKEITGNNETLFGVITRGVGGFDTLQLAMSEATDEMEKQSAMNVELQNRLNSLEGITGQIGQTFRFLGDSLALALIPSLKTALTGVLDFTRGILGLEQTGDRTTSAATRIGTAFGTVGRAATTGIGEFVSSLRSGEAQTQTFAAGLGSSLGNVGRVVGETVRIVTGGVAPILQNAYASLASFVQTSVANVASSNAVFSRIFTGLGTIVASSVSFIRDILESVPKTYFILTEASSDLSNSVSRIFQGIGSVLQGFGYLVYGYVVEPFVKMTEPIRGAAVDVLATVQGWVGQLGRFFQPVVDLAQKVGISIGGAFKNSAEISRAALNDLVSGGVQPFVQSADMYVGGSDSIRRANELIQFGVTGVVNAVDDAENAVTRTGQKFDELGTQGERSGKKLASSNQAVTDSSNAAADAANVLAQEFAAAGDGAEQGAEGQQQFAAASEEVDRTASQMAKNIVKAYEAGRIGITTAIQGLQTKLGELKTAKAEALASGDYDAADLAAFNRDITTTNGLLQDLAGTGKLLPIPAVTALVAAAKELPIPTVTAFVAAARDMPIPEVTAMAGALVKLDVPLPTASVIDYAGTIKGDLATAYQDATAEARLFGDMTSQTAIAAEIAKAELERLIDAGLKPQDEAVRVVSEEYLRLQNELKETAAAAERYQTNLTTTRDAQEALRDGTVDSAEAARAMAAELEEAAKGTGELGVQARAAIKELNNYATGLDALSAVSSIFGDLGDSIRNSGTKEALDELKVSRDELLKAGSYDSSDLDSLNATIETLEQNLGDEQRWESVFSAIEEGATTAFTALEEGAEAGEVAIRALAGAFSAMQSDGADAIVVIDDVTRAAKQQADASASFLSQLASGNFVGAFITAGVSLVTDAINFFDILINGNQKTNEELARIEQERVAAAQAALEKFQEQQRAYIESMREGQRELAKLAGEARDTLNDLNKSVEESRLEFAKTNGADEGLVFISETILDLRDQSAEFNAEMQRITKDKNDFIAAYLKAHPGAGRAEAEAAAEAIFGPQRESLKEQFALTAATTLTGAAEQAKALGLSQEEFYTAVLSGNTELLGNMTEGQRQAMVQVIRLMQELGIEIPKALQDAIGNVEAAQAESGQQLAEGQQRASEQQIAALEKEKEDYKTAWAKRSQVLLELIANSTGETKKMYQDMFVAEQAAFTEGLAQRNSTINAARDQSTQVDVEGLQKQRDALKAAYDKNVAEIKEKLEQGLITEAEAIRQREKLAADYYAADKPLREAIAESGDGIGSEIESNAQGTVNAINQDIADLNTAWANRSAQLKDLIARSTGDAKAEYQRQYEEEAAEYEATRRDLAQRQQEANQSLLDARDKGSADWLAAQEEIGKRERESLGGIYEQLRAILGPDADLIISMIENTYNRRREAYLADGAATADAAAQANQGELDQLSSIYEQLRAILGPDADIIISMIQGTYEKRQAAYQSGGDAAANAAATSAEAERQSIANVNQILRDIFGPEAQGIIDQILALYDKRAKAYESGGNGAATAAQASAETERQSIANINQLLRDIFGPEAQGIIDQILALYNKREQAYREGGEGAAAGATEGSEAEATAQEQGTQRTIGAIADSDARTQAALDTRTKNVAGKLLADGGIADLIKNNSDAFFKNFQDGGSLATQGIDSSTKQIDGSLVSREALLRGALGKEALISQDALTAAAGLGNAFTQGGSIVTQGLAQSAQSILGGIAGRDSLLTGSLTGSYLRMAAAQTSGSSTFNSAILSGGAQLQGSFSTTFNALANVFNSGAGSYLGAISAGFGNLTGAYRTQSSTFGSTVLSGGQQVSGATGSAFSLMGGAQNQGSSQYQGVILRSGQQLSGAQTQLTSLVTGALRSMGSTVGGALSSTYGSLVGAQNSGASNYIGAINNAARGEKGAIDQGSGVVTGALGGFRQSITGSIDSTYSGIGGAHLRGSSSYQGVVRSGADKERSALSSAASTVTGQLSSSARSIVGGIQQHFSLQESAYERAIGSYVGTINSQRSRLETALNAVASFIKNFKYPTPPAPPALPSARASADPGNFAPMVSFGVPDLSIASVGAYAADGLPDVATYASATGSVRAYAAAAAPLLDMFDVSTPNLRLTNVQERSLSLTIGGADNFGKAFEKPIASFERAINFLWETVKYDRETTLLFRRTVDDFGTKAKTTREALAPGTRHQAKRRR